MKVIKKQYESVGAFQSDVCADPGRRCLAEWQTQGGDSFGGAPVCEIVGPLRAGWAAGVEQARALGGGVNLAPASEARMVRRWADDSQDGIDWDPERAAYEMAPVLQRRPVRVGGAIRGVRSFVVNVSSSWRVGASALLFKALAVAAVVDVLESAGVRCEVWAVGGFDCSREFQCFAYRVKAAPDPLNLGALCSAVAPWALRFWGFSWQDRHGVIVPSNRGQPPAIKNIIECFDFPGVMGGVIDKEDCLNSEAARAWVLRCCEGAS